ncbi:MAG: hypothetical protein ACRDOE_00160 [Streptosporangiaceae bacterium]
MTRLLQGAWRLVRLAGFTYGATLVATPAPPTRAAEIAGAVATAETLYRAVVPVKDQTRLANLVRILARAFVDAKVTGSPPAPAIPSAPPAPALSGPSLNDAQPGPAGAVVHTGHG